jgi:hypothetical protein
MDIFDVLIPNIPVSAFKKIQLASNSLLLEMRVVSLRHLFTRFAELIQDPLSDDRVVQASLVNFLRALRQTCKELNGQPPYAELLGIARKFTDVNSSNIVQASDDIFATLGAIETSCSH